MSLNSLSTFNIFNYSNKHVTNCNFFPQVNGNNSLKRFNILANESIFTECFPFDGTIDTSILPLLLSECQER